MTAPDIARVVETARRAAAAANHAFVGTEHLLAAALLEPDAAPARFLRARGLTPEALAEELLAGLPVAESGRDGPPPLSRFAERALADAEPAHGNLVAVLLRAPRGRVSGVLARHGLKVAELRQAVESKPELKAPPPPIRESPPAERRLPPHLQRQKRPGTLLKGFRWSWVLFLAVPAGALLRWQTADARLVFATACIGMVPLAGLLARATDQLAARTGPMVGGLLSATFGNAAELIIAVAALRAGLVDLVKASIAGSILGNLLLILGLALVAGGVRSPILKFNRTAAGMSAVMLALAVAGLVFPALFRGGNLGSSELGLSDVVAVILALTYAGSLLFTLRTHRAMFSAEAGTPPSGIPWRPLAAILVLAVATAGVALESELLVGSIEPVTRSLGLSQTFLGLILIPLIGNAAEHGAAVTVARAGKTELALQIAMGSSTQVALLVAPLLVLAGVLIGQPLSLRFTPLEVVALGVATGVVALITLDGESNWFEGVQLLALYGMVGAAAYFG